MNTLKFNEKYYQPVLIDKKFFVKFENKYLKDNSERDCTERLKTIFNHLKGTGTILDIGCNIGLFTHAAQDKGFEATGIDNNKHTEVKRFCKTDSLEVAKELSIIYDIYPEFVRGDYKEYIKQHKFDYIFYLSVWHHHLVGYDKTNEYMQIFFDVIDSANKGIYFEIDPKHLKKINMSIDEFIKFVELKKNVKFELLGEVNEQSKVINYKFDRKLYYINIEDKR